MSDSSDALLNVAVIGTGMRATSYFRSLPEALRSRVRLSAVCDPSERNRLFFAEQFGDTDTLHYTDACDLFAADPADALIIASPNDCHCEQIIAALKWNIPILLEKPVCISLEECQAIWQAWLKSGQPVVAVGFVLRYTPFYRKVLEVVRSGVLGQILQVDGDEIISTALTSVFFREGWRLRDRCTGGFLVEKCCHDFDVLSVMAAAPVKRLCSFAARTHFVQRPRSEQNPRFDPEITRSLALDYGDVFIKRHFESVSDASVYSGESEVPDHQSVLVEYENGVLTTLTVTFGQPRQTRLIRIMGSNGMLSGDFQSSTITWEVGSVDSSAWDRNEIKVEHDESGHHGGDTHINHAFWNAAFGKEEIIHAGLREGLEAVITAICAEKSKRTGAPVDVAQARRFVFAPSASPGPVSATPSCEITR